MGFSLILRNSFRRSFESLANARKYATASFRCPTDPELSPMIHVRGSRRGLITAINPLLLPTYLACAHNSTRNNAAVYGPRPPRTVSGGSFPRSWSLVHALDKRSPTGSRPFRPLARVSTLFVRGKNGAREDRPERKGSAAQNTYVTVTNLSR